MSWLKSGIFLALAVAPLGAQQDVPLLRPEERRAVDRQSDDFNRVMMPVLAEAAKSTVRVWAGNRRLAYGTVVGDGRTVLTKWSEIAGAAKSLRIAAGSGMEPSDVRAVKVVGVYEDVDLAVLAVVGEVLPPVAWSEDVPVLGAFLAAPQPDGRPAGNGVVSVLERNTRETDQAFLGVMGDPEYRGGGVRVASVEEGTGAAAAGLAEGDVILRVGDRGISGLLELRNALVGRTPGETLEMEIRRGEETEVVEVLLGNRPRLPQFSGARLQQMERMGGAVSRVRGPFPNVVQTDLKVSPEQVGGPVVNLRGEVVGLLIARVDRTRSFMISAAAVRSLLESEAVDPGVAKVGLDTGDGRMQARAEGGQRNEARPRGRAIPGNQERMRRHLTDMERLMEMMREEMRGIDDGTP